MARKVILFGALFFSGLVAGAAFVIWIEYNPSDLAASGYTESMHHAIQVFTVPLPTIVMLSVLFTGASSVLAWRERPIFYLLAAGCFCAVVVAVVTVFGNVPINNQIKTWTVASPPSNWSDFANAWWRFQSVRTIAALAGLMLVILATLNTQKISGKNHLNSPKRRAD